MPRLVVGDHATASPGLGHRPRLEQGKTEALLEHGVVPPVHPRPEPEPHGVGPVRVHSGGAPSSIEGITPR